MAQVTAFVDDVVLGRLPSLCVKEGVPTEDRLNLRSAVGGSGLGFAWLLILLGPLGWIILGFVALAHPSGGYLTARLPFSQFAYRRLVVARRMLRVWLGAAAVAGVLALLSLGLQRSGSAAAAVVLGAAALAALFKAGVESRRLRYAQVQIEMDASRRWITIYGAHPDFVSAVAAMQADRSEQSDRL
jgi:hypothetical protein